MLCTMNAQRVGDNVVAVGVGGPVVFLGGIRASSLPLSATVYMAASSKPSLQRLMIVSFLSAWRYSPRSNGLVSCQSASRYAASFCVFPILNRAW